MAGGTRAVPSAHGAFPELITAGSDKALFPPADEDALVDILADINANPQRWDGYGQQGRQTYRSRFSPDVGIARLLEIYRFAVENPIEGSGRLQTGAFPVGSVQPSEKMAKRGTSLSVRGSRRPKPD
jgi:hypothetical protein